jgi:hypothetical protein
MARRVFFSFHYERDIMRVSQVRNSGITKAGYENAGFIDHADWEALERTGEAAIKRWINTQLDGASVTVVLIGAETAARPWVRYEIEQSYAQKKGLLGIRIHNLKDPRTSQPDSYGADPFAGVTVFDGLRYISLGGRYPVYDWVHHDGYNNFGSWVEAAAKEAGR